MCALASQETTGKSPGSKVDHHVIAGWSGAVLDAGVLWLVLISFPYWGEVGKPQMAVQGQGSAFWHAPGRGQLQGGCTIKRHHEVPGKERGDLSNVLHAEK